MRRSELYLNFIESLHIRTRDLKIIPFKLNPVQRLLWEKIAPLLDDHQKIWLIILKARREGVSTLLEALMLARTVLEDNVHSLVMASKAANTREIWNMASTMVDLDPLLKQVSSKVNKSIMFGRSKLIIATAGTEDTTRGFDLTCLHGSEVGFWPRPETMLAAMQCLPEHIDSFCFLESTANGKVGVGELFFNEWTRAENGDSGFTPVFLPWYIMAEYRIEHGQPLTDLDEEERTLMDQYGIDEAQLRWRRWCIASKCQGDLEKFHQEYPTTPMEAFIQSGRPFFTNAQLLPFWKEVKAGVKYSVAANGTWREDPQGPWEVFVEPDPAHQYGIGADTSMGLADEDDEKDTHSMSTGVVLDWQSLEVVAVYEASSAPHEQAKDLVGMARIYNNALICPEVESSGGGGGRELIVFIHELNYWQIHGWKMPDRINPHKYALLGWATNSRTRPRMLARIREAILERSITIYSAKVLKQLGDFGQTDSGRWESIKGHDDLLFALGMALVSRYENYIKVLPKGEDPGEPPWKEFGLDVQHGPGAARAWKRERLLTEDDYTYLDL